MSKKAVKTVRDATRKSGGATLTKSGRSSALQKFFREMSLVLNVQVTSFEKLKASQVKTYVDHLKASGNSDRSIQNQLSHLRQGLKSVGREHYADCELMSTQ